MANVPTSYVYVQERTKPADEAVGNCYHRVFFQLRTQQHVLTEKLDKILLLNKINCFVYL